MLRSHLRLDGIAHASSSCLYNAREDRMVPGACYPDNLLKYAGSWFSEICLKKINKVDIDIRKDTQYVTNSSFIEHIHIYTNDLAKSNMYTEIPGNQTSLVVDYACVGEIRPLSGGATIE